MNPAQAPARREAEGSGRTVARTGLRMMPTFPPSPLRFRTAGFPQYGSKAGLSGGAFPGGAHVPRRRVCIRPSCTPRSATRVPLNVGESVRWCTAVRATSVALPQGPSLRSGLYCPGPSTLNRPHPPHSQARRHFAAQRLIGDAFAVPAGLGDPRVVPCFRCTLFPNMPSSTTPGSSSAACTQFLRRRRWPSPEYQRLGAPNCPTIRFKWEYHFGASRFAHGLRPSLRPAGLLAPLADPTGLTQPTGTFTSGLPAARSPSPQPDMTTVASGQAPPAGLSPARTSASIAAQYSLYFEGPQRRPATLIGDAADGSYFRCPCHTVSENKECGVSS